MSVREPSWWCDGEFKLCLELWENGRQVREQALGRADFLRAVQATMFDALRHQKTSQYNPLPEAARVEPIFPPVQENSPWASGFLVSAALPSGELYQREFGVHYFASSAARLRNRLTQEGKLKPGSQPTYQLAAYYDSVTGVPLPRAKSPISFEAPQFNVPIRKVRQVDFGDWMPWDDPDDQDVKVAVEQEVLEQAVEEARDAPDKEVCGFLAGHVMQEPNGDVFVLVTGLASGAGTTEASGTSVTFTPSTFVAARNILRLRDADETIVGWFHSHPFRFCEACPLPTPSECISKVMFYSQDDVHVMERAFDQPFMVGLLAAVEPRIETAIGHLPVRLYGWRDGSVQQRGFHVVNSRTD